MVVFKDSNASFGRVKPFNSEKTIIPATSPSRSLDFLITDKTIQIEIQDNGYMILDFSNVIGNRVKISKTNSLKLSKYIQETYAKRKKLKEVE